MANNLVGLFNTMDYGSSRNSLCLIKNWIGEKGCLKIFINGQLEAETEEVKYCDIKDKSTGDVISCISRASKPDMERSIQSSVDGLEAWSNIRSSRKGKLIRNVMKNIENQKELLSEVEAVTFGTSPSRAKNSDILLAARFCQYYSGWAHLSTETVKHNTHGVVICCFAEHTPLVAFVATVSSALATGCAVILSPPVEAPLTAFLLAQLCMQAGLPKGVINVVPDCTELLTEQLEGKFLGVTLWGPRSYAQIMSQKFTHISRPITTFCFGKAVSIIFGSADLCSALHVLLRNVCFSYIQYPWSVRTILVEESIFSKFMEELNARIATLKTGTFLDVGIDVGLPGKDDKTKVFLENVVQHFRERGVEVRHIAAADSLFFPPTIVIGTDAEIHSVSQDYDILPFLSIMPFRSAKEAVDIVNKSHFGVAVSIWTNDLPVAVDVACNVEAGTVWINDHGVLDPSVPFAGWKQNGFGCFGGEEGLAQYSTLKMETNTTVSVQSECLGKENKELPVKTYDLHYGGSFKKSSSNMVWPTPTPCGMCNVQLSNVEDVKKAVGSAASAQKKWWQYGTYERAALLLNVAEKFEEDHSYFQKYFTSAAGSAELEKCVEHIYKWAAYCNTYPFKHNQNPVRNMFVEVLHQPRGVICIIIDDASELEFLVHYAMCALSFGNSVVVVPTSRNPVQALEFCNWLSSAKIPAGLVNVIPTYKNLYREIVDHWNVHAVWYIGDYSDTYRFLCQEANRALKCLQKFSGLETLSSGSLAYAATHTKCVWLPSEGLCN